MSDTFRLHASFEHDLRRPPITKLQSVLRFYEDNYEIIFQHFLRPGKRFYLGDKTNQYCRFCSKSPQLCSFKKDAHAIPESLGNRGLLTYYECDSCNAFFGQGMENHFGNWSLPNRTLARISGKRGRPSMSKGSTGGWRIEPTDTGLQIMSFEADPIFEVDAENKTMTLHLRRDPYIPVLVMKAFVKMGLAVMPNSELINFQQAFQWLQLEDHTVGLINPHPAFRTLVSALMPNDFISLLILRRKYDHCKVPYCSFVLSYGNEVFQFFLPSPERNQRIRGQMVSIPPFPDVSKEPTTKLGVSFTERLDLTGETIVKSESVSFTLAYENRTSLGEPA